MFAEPKAANHPVLDTRRCSATGVASDGLVRPRRKRSSALP